MTDQDRPEIVVLCGSTRFLDAFLDTNFRLTLAGHVVLSVGCVTTSEHELGEIDAEAKARLDDLHLRKIELADRVLVLNVGGYVGPSTAGEIVYATSLGKPVEYLEPEHAPTLAEIFARPGAEARTPWAASDTGSADTSTSALDAEVDRLFSDSYKARVDTALSQLDAAKLRLICEVQGQTINRQEESITRVIIDAGFPNGRGTLPDRVAQALCCARQAGYEDALAAMRSADGVTTP